MLRAVPKSTDTLGVPTSAEMSEKHDFFFKDFKESLKHNFDYEQVIQNLLRGYRQ